MGSSRGPAALVLCCVALFTRAPAAETQRPHPDPFLFLRPCVAIPADDLRRLEAGDTVVRSLPAEAREVATFAARRVAIDADRLVAWIREIAALKRSPMVEAIGRFSDPPDLADLDALSLGPADLADLRACRPGDCGLKLTSAEIASLRREIDAGGDWHARVQRAFRQLTLDRVQRYLKGGHASLGRYDDGHAPESLADAFSLILKRSPCLETASPALAAYLAASPAAALPALERFLYWSQERLAGRPVISASDVVIARDGPDGARTVFVAGKQLFATHYLNGSLNLTMLVGGEGSARYLLILNRARVDVVQGFFGGLTRVFVQRRLRSELSGVIEGLAKRLESGPPKS
jgi:hypothetical protein